MKRQRNLTWMMAAGLGCLAVLAPGCDTDSPTAPQQVPAPPPSGGSGARWNISLDISPSSQIVDGTAPSVISIRVTRAGGGEPPVRGTAAALTTTLGELNTVAVPGNPPLSALAVELVNGKADLYFFPGSSTGEALVTAQVERDVGSAAIQIRADAIFITGLSPNSGPQGGGTRVTVEGLGFAPPLQVLFGGLQGTNVDVGAKGQKVKVTTPGILDPDSFFNSEICDADGDGIEDGLRLIPTAVDVTIQLSNGGSGTFAKGFVYNPSNQSCVETPDPPPPPPVPVIASFTFVKDGAAVCPCVVIFTDTSTGDPTSWSWNFDFTGIGGASPSTSTTQNPVVTFTPAPSPGTYTVQLTATNALGSHTVSQFVTVP